MRVRAADSRAVEVALAFLKLGLTSFGGPVAHLGYFRTEFVARRRWLDDTEYSDLVALCQMLPGPASSQVGIALGLTRAGWAGAVLAWAGFTLPSALALILFAKGLASHPGWAAAGAVRGLKVVAVAIVAQAVWGMARSLCTDRPRVGIALVAAATVLALPSAGGQIVAIVLAGLMARWTVAVAPAAPRPNTPPAPARIECGVSRHAGVAAAVLFAVLLLAFGLWAGWSASPTAVLIAGFFRSGALVFGGGHVVLPLLQSVVVPSGMVTEADFLAGYGATQAVPGPLFTFAAYLGARATGPLHGAAGGLVALLAVFLPAFLLVVAALPFWQALRARPGLRSTLAGINAGVVGILGAALVHPVATGGLHSLVDAGLALAALFLLMWARVSPVLVVALAAAAGALWLGGAG